MDANKPYTPVGCDFIDQIEIAATSGKEVSVRFIEDGFQKENKAKLKTWFAKDKVEYLQTVSGQVIRLDEVISINDFKNTSTCSV